MAELAPRAALGRDAGTSHDEMIKLVCRLLRMSHWWLLLGGMYHVLLCLNLPAADLYTALAKLVFNVLVQLATAYATVRGKSWVFELQAIQSIASASQCVLALCMLAGREEWTVREIAVMMFTRPLLSFGIMCGHSALAVVDSAEPHWVLVVSCTAFNAAVAWKVIFSMTTFEGVILSASMSYVQLFVGAALKTTSNALHTERDVLKLVRDGLQQHVDSQDSMWKSVFDATLLCDSTSAVVNASAQAVDLLQFETADAVVGQAFSGLAAPGEQSRISRFLQEVVSSTSSQAMTIQSIFLQKGQAIVELKINAVRVVQSIYDSSSESSFGILVGARLVEAPREETSPARPPEDTPAQMGAADSEDMWIAFDAGTENFAISECSPGIFSECEQHGLLSWTSHMARHGLETWVVDEVAACGQLGSTSSTVIEQFHLKIPAAPARSRSAEKAWLKFCPQRLTRTMSCRCRPFFGCAVCQASSGGARAMAGSRPGAPCGPCGSSSS
ncbi:unnamed protein product [Prorocentrum cordatum]|uniref:Protein RFT1 homolog n=1 Tax=Prorocentrum cordatum TaxID=2364126 RepID=A0ABN9SMX2_9DINO|nr:unnamed protein product [Polarella glacialis]